MPHCVSTAENFRQQLHWLATSQCLLARHLTYISRTSQCTVGQNAQKNLKKYLVHFGRIWKKNGLFKSLLYIAVFPPPKHGAYLCIVYNFWPFLGTRKATLISGNSSCDFWNKKPQKINFFTKYLGRTRCARKKFAHFVKLHCHLECATEKQD